MNWHSAIESRVAPLVAAWGLAEQELGQAVSSRIDDDASTGALWQFACAVLGEFPDRPTMVGLKSAIAIMGTAEAVENFVQEREVVERSLSRRGVSSPSVEIVPRAYIVDVYDTCRTARTSGIQRVVREIVRRWNSTQEILLVSWNEKAPGFRRLYERETNSVLGIKTAVVEAADEPLPMLIPLDGSLAVVELAAERWRAVRVEALASFSGLTVNVVGYDCVPMTASETAEGLSGNFPIYLDALARTNVIAAISHAAATEFVGWKKMLRPIGIPGPSIGAIDLASELAPPSLEDLEMASRELGIHPTRPLILVVGSHEPRKNHLAVLQAAERLWRSGHDFKMVFIGGHTWSSDRFHNEVLKLHKRKRPIQMIIDSTDGLLSSAYRLARFTVFPSVHEGFGLPVTESLDAGTPVITSDLGSMRDIVVAGGGGGLLVNPRSDNEIYDAMLRLLKDDALVAELRSQAASRVPRTWADYGDELWEFFADPSRSVMTPSGT